MTEDGFEARTRSLQTGALVLFILIGVVFVLVQWRDILVPIAIAVIVWYIILALSEAFARLSVAGWRPPKLACTWAALVSVLAAGIGFVNLIRISISAIQQAAPRYEQQIERVIEKLAGKLGLASAPILAEINTALDFENLAGYFLQSVTSIVFTTIIIFFYVLFLMVQQQYMPRKMALIIKDPGRRKTVETVIERIHRDIQIYIGVMSFLAIVTGGITYIVLRLVGVDFAVLWSVVIALLSFIPTIGTVFGIAFPAIVALLQFDTLTPFFIVLATLGTAQLLLNNLAQPALMGKSLNLSPFIILVALAVWGTIWGVVGAVLSIPITVAATIMMAQVPATRPYAVILSHDGEVD